MRIVQWVPVRYGTAYGFFGGGDAGRQACEAIDQLNKMNAVDTLLTSFIQPLQTQPDAASRIHCSLNLNTETGESALRPLFPSYYR